MSIYVPPRPSAVSHKAATGIGTNYFLSGEPLLASLGNDPQQRMRRAWQLGVSVPWIRAAERLITNLGSTVDWHLEDGEDVEIDDQYPSPLAQSARAIIERPQALLPIGQKMSRRGLWALTLRHVGLCGNAFWLLDQPTVDGLPGAIIYIRPDRMTARYDGVGNLVRWEVDADGQRDGVPLELESVVQFVLDPPDQGAFGIGLVESAIAKAELSNALDRHLGVVIGSGSRKTGILAPKTGMWDDVQYQQIVNDWRVASEGGDAARRAQILRGPVDFIETQLGPADMMIRDLMTGLRDDLLALWGVPGSALGLHDRGRGLGATTASANDDIALWRNAVITRLVAFREPVQFELLDRWQAVGATVELELDTPQFDDDAPQFDKAQKSAGVAMTRNQRLALIGIEPLPDYGPDGQPLGLAIDLPVNLVTVGAGPDAAGAFAPTAALPAGPLPVEKAGEAKARTITTGLVRLRAQVERRTTPRLRTAIAAFLADQRRDIVARLREHADQVAAKPNDWQAWMPRSWDGRLHDLLKPYLVGMAQPVAQHIADILPPLPGKAAPTGAVERVLSRGATRVQGINETTRRKINDAIIRGLSDGLSVNDVADMIESDDGVIGGLTLDGLFDAYRAELIARTELMAAYNGAALGSYADGGVQQVQAIDGDGDPECAERDGRVYDVDEADGIDDHPNGTLDWAPIIDYDSLEAA